MQDDFRTVQRWNLPGDAHESTFSCFHERRLLTSQQTCQWLAEAINDAVDKHQMHVWSYVFMPEHVHLLYFPLQEEYSVSDFLGCVKKSVARRAIGYVRRVNPLGLAQLATGQKRSPYRFWQAGGGYDRNVNDVRTARWMARYIHNNPVRREFVALPEEWPWSSANFWETGVQGPVRVDPTYFP